MSTRGRASVMGPRRLLIEEDTIPIFISEVKKRECIWNPENEHYNDRYESMIAWREIALAMEQPEELLKSKWKNLRDLFKREMKKWKKIDSVENYKGKWRFFKAMWFMHKHRPIENSGNDHADESNEETCIDDDDSPLQNFVKCEPLDNNQEEEEEELYVDVDPVSARIPTMKRKRDEDSDFDMMFLKSLTPYFRQIEPMRKLIVRSKIQDILINEMAAQQQQSQTK